MAVAVRIAIVPLIAAMLCATSTVNASRSSLQFEDFERASVKGPLYEAIAAMLRTCPPDQSRVEAHVKLVSSAVITGTPTLMIGGKLISDFQQAEIEASLYSETTVDAQP